MPLSGTVQITLSDNRQLTYTGYVREDFDNCLREAAPHGISRVEGQALRNFIFKDRILDSDEQLSAFLLSACTQLGGRIKSISYESSHANNPVAFQCKMHPSTCKKTHMDLVGDVKQTKTNSSLGVIERMLQGRIPQQQTLDRVFGQKSDVELAKRIRDHFAAEDSNDKWAERSPTGGPLKHDDVRWLINEVRDAPHVGKETVNLLMNIIRDSRFEDPDDWSSMRSVLQQHYGEIKQFFSPERIVVELFRMADKFAAHRNSISLEEGAKLLALGAMEGIPSPGVQRALQIICERFDFTEAAHGAFAAYISSLPAAAPKEWTFFVYLAGDNDLESFGLADVNEMEAAYKNVAKFMNVVVLVDGAKYESVGDSPVYNWKSKTRMLHIQADGQEDGRTVVSKEVPIPNNCALGELMRKNRGELNMASGETLKAAVEFAQKAFPSDHFFLDIWNHGDSWRGVAADNSSNYERDMIRMKELTEALTEIPKKVDVLGFDACLMGNFSVAEAAQRANVSYLVASEEVEPGDGWNYEDVLKRLGWLRSRSDSLSPEDAAKSVVNVFDGPTLSAMRLEDIPTIRKGIDRLGEELLHEGGLSNEAIDKITEASRCTEYDSAAVDAVVLCNKLAAHYGADSPIGNAANDLAALLGKSLVANQTSVDYTPTSKGVTFFIPALGWGTSEFARSGSKWLASCPNWKRFVHGQAN